MTGDSETGIQIYFNVKLHNMQEMYFVCPMIIPDSKSQSINENKSLMWEEMISLSFSTLQESEVNFTQCSDFSGTLMALCIFPQYTWMQVTFFSSVVESSIDFALLLKPWSSRPQSFKPHHHFQIKPEPVVKPPSPPTEMAVCQRVIRVSRDSSRRPSCHDSTQLCSLDEIWKQNAVRHPLNLRLIHLDIWLN